MRHDGKIVRWDDDKGFGFISPSEGGGDVFVHISSFESGTRRPVASDVVSYEVSSDDRGRPRASRVMLADDRDLASDVSIICRPYWIVAAAFLATVTAIALSGRLPMAVAGLYLIASGAAYVAYAFDKSAARQGKWRTKESTLQMLSLIGGWPGALIAQRHLRHKTQKLSFQFVFWISVAFNCVLLAWVLSPAGSDTLRMGLDAIPSILEPR